MLTAGLIVSGAIVGIEHVVDKPRSRAVQIANQELISGKYKLWFWVGGVMFGHLLPMLILVVRADLVGVLCGFSAVCGLYCYEYGFVLCAQEVPNS